MAPYFSKKLSNITLDEGEFQLYEFPSIIVPGYPGANEGSILKIDAGSAASIINFTHSVLMIKPTTAGSYPINVII